MLSESNPNVWWRLKLQVELNASFDAAVMSISAHEKWPAICKKEEGRIKTAVILDRFRFDINYLCFWLQEIIQKSANMHLWNVMLVRRLSGPVDTVIYCVIYVVESLV